MSRVALMSLKSIAGMRARWLEIFILVFILALAGPLLAVAAEPAGQALAARLGTRGA